MPSIFKNLGMIHKTVLDCKAASCNSTFLFMTCLEAPLFLQIPVLELESSFKNLISFKYLQTGGYIDDLKYQ